MNTDLSVLILSVCGLAVFLLTLAYFSTMTFWDIPRAIPMPFLGFLFMVTCFVVAASFYASNAREMQKRKQEKRIREMEERIRRLEEEKEKSETS